MPSDTPRVLIVSAGLGSGHNTVASQLACAAAERGVTARVVDLITAAGPAGERVRSTYERLLRYAPWVYGAAMEFWRRWPGPLERFTAWRAGPFERALVIAAAETRPDVVVSTHNLASQAVGRLIRSGRLTAPAVTIVVDPGAHPYWVADGVEHLLAPTRLTAAELRRYGARNVTVIDPVLRPPFCPPPSRGRARVAVGLPEDATCVLVNGGSWAVGRLDATVDAVRSVPGVETLVLCGRDERLRRHMGSRPGVRALGWTDDMADLLAAVDVVIDNAGGQTCWETLACGTPVLLYRPLPGHGTLNASTLHRLGLARWIRGRSELIDTLRTKTFRSGAPPLAVDTGADALRHVLDVAGVRR